MVNTLMFCVNILVICADCAGHPYSEFHGIKELNSSKHKLAKSRNFQPNGHVQPYEFKISKHYQEWNSKRDTPWSHVLRDIKIQRATFDQAVFATGLSKLLQLLLVNIRCWAGRLAMEYFGQAWTFNYSAAHDWYSCSFQDNKIVFLKWDRVDQMLFTGPPHSSPKTFTSMEPDRVKTHKTDVVFYGLRFT